MQCFVTFMYCVLLTKCTPDQTSQAVPYGHIFSFMLLYPGSL